MLVRSESFKIDADPEVKNLQIATNPNNFKSVVTFIDQKEAWQVFLIDPFGTQTIINIGSILKMNIVDSTLTSTVVSCSFQEIVLLQFSNCNVAAFDNFGQLVKLSLPQMSNQNATLNYHLMNVQITSISFHKQLLLFTTLGQLHIIPISYSGDQPSSRSGKEVFSRCRKIATAFPVNVLQGVLIDDKLFNHQERVFFNTTCALKT